MVYSNIISFIRSLEKHPIANRLARGAFWSLAGNSLSRIFSLVASILIARILGKADFGAYGMVQSSVELFGFFAGFGLRSAGTIHIAQWHRVDSERTGAVISFTTGISIITAFAIFITLLVFAPSLAESSLRRPDLTETLCIGAVCLFFSNLSSVQGGCLAGFEEFNTIARIAFWRGLVGAFVCVPLAWAHGINGAMGGLALAALFEFSLSRLAVHRQCRTRCISVARWSFSLLRTELHMISNLALPTFLHGLVVVLAMWLCNVITVRQSGGYAELGLFNAANQWSNLVTFIPQVLPFVMLPIFADTFRRKHTGEFASALVLNIRLTWVISLPMAIFVIVFRDSLAMVFGEEFAHISLLIPLLMLNAFMSIINSVLGAALSSAGRAWIGMGFNVSWALILVSFTALLTPRHGALGLAIAYSIAYFVHTIVQLSYAQLKFARPAALAQLSLILLTTIVFGFAIVSEFVGIQSKVPGFIGLGLSLLPIYQWVRLIISQRYNLAF